MISQPRLRTLMQTHLWANQSACTISVIFLEEPGGHMHPRFVPGQLARQSFFLDTNNNAILSFLDFTGSEHWAIHCS